MRRIRIYKKKKRKINIERLHLEELRLTPLKPSSEHFKA